MRMVGLFFISCLFGDSSAMLATLNPRISSRTGVVDFLKSARATVSESCTSSRLDLGISFAISGMTFYQLANVRSRKDQLIRAIDARMSRRPYLFEADRTLDKLWQAREKVKVSGDKLNEALKKSMIVGAILDGAVKYLDYLKRFANPFPDNRNKANGSTNPSKNRSEYTKTLVGNDSNEPNELQRSESSDDRTSTNSNIRLELPLTVCSIGICAYAFDKISDLNLAVKEAKRLLNTPKYKNE